MFAISTAGFDRHSILWELYSHACRVRDGAVEDPTFLPLLFEAPVDADWTDEAVWHACNPALGDFRSLEEMQTLAQRAKAIPAQENTFRRLYLNQWTEQDERWIPMDAWDRCKAEIELPPRSGYHSVWISCARLAPRLPTPRRKRCSKPLRTILDRRVSLWSGRSPC